jgi:poly(A) polymerase Pap1
MPAFKKIIYATTILSMLELRQLSEAYVPVIKFLFDEIEVDLTFARLNRPVPREEKELLVGN